MLLARARRRDGDDEGGGGVETFSLVENESRVNCNFCCEGGCFHSGWSEGSGVQSIFYVKKCTKMDGCFTYGGKVEI